MEKTIHTSEYAVLLDLLRETRRTAGVTQVELAERLGKSQSFVSKVEVGETRVDVIQLRTICLAINSSLPELVDKLEERLTKRGRRR